MGMGVHFLNLEGRSKTREAIVVWDPKKLHVSLPIRETNACSPNTDREENAESEMAEKNLPGNAGFPV